jgi:hypothetical protein
MPILMAEELLPLGYVLKERRQACLTNVKAGRRKAMLPPGST